MSKTKKSKNVNKFKSLIKIRWKCYKYIQNFLKNFHFLNFWKVFIEDNEFSIDYNNIVEGGFS